MDEHTTPEEHDAPVEPRDIHWIDRVSAAALVRLL